MKRLAPILAVLAGLVLAAPAAAKAPRATVTSCDRTHGTAVFEGRMDTMRHAVRMQMRFRLQVSTPDEPDWTGLPVPGFSSWVTSDPGRTRYVYTKRVEALFAPASYRVSTRFRWLDAQGETIRSARVRSKSCRQPDPRADLRVVGVSLAPADGSGDRYDITVRNAGRTDAAASIVRVALPGGAVVTADVPPIADGDRDDVFVSGPACRPGSTLTVTADAGDAVDERDEDNAFSLPCPSV
jgi:CARDB protein